MVPLVKRGEELAPAVEEVVSVGDDDGIGDEPGVEGRGDHAVEGFFFPAGSEVEGPGEVADGGRSAQAGVAVDEEAVGASGTAAGIEPEEELLDSGVGGGTGVIGGVDVVEEFVEVVFRGDPGRAVGGDGLGSGAGILERHKVGGGEALGAVGPLARADEDFHEGVAKRLLRFHVPQLRVRRGEVILGSWPS